MTILLLSVTKRKHTITYLFVFLLTFVGSVFWFMTPPPQTKGEVNTSFSQKDTEGKEVPPSKNIKGDYVVVDLANKELLLKNNEAILAVYPIMSSGKPGSYYETIGGYYENDYKKELHFSSIGHVYMPYSVHVFGNYFIHGIPYYEDGTKVSSTYSGGCIRINDEDMKKIYAFIKKGTPIIITKENEMLFHPTKKSVGTFESFDMTILMVATISLEVLTQDNEFMLSDGTITTRRKLLPRLVKEGDTTTAMLYAESLGEDTFLSLMNQKAKALGLSNTLFTGITSGAITTYDDYVRFMEYIQEYKSYLKKL